MNQVMQLVILFCGYWQRGIEFGTGKRHVGRRTAATLSSGGCAFSGRSFAAAITAGITDDTQQILTEAQNAGKKGWNKLKKIMNDPSNIVEEMLEGLVKAIQNLFIV